MELSIPHCRHVAFDLPWHDDFYYSLASPLLRIELSERVVRLEPWQESVDHWRMLGAFGRWGGVIEIWNEGNVVVTRAEVNRRLRVSCDTWLKLQARNLHLYAIPWHKAWPARDCKETDAFWAPWIPRTTDESPSWVRWGMRDRVNIAMHEENVDDLIQAFNGPEEFGELWEVGENHGFPGPTVVARTAQR